MRHPNQYPKLFSLCSIPRLNVICVTPHRNIRTAPVAPTLAKAMALVGRHPPDRRVRGIRVPHGSLGGGAGVGMLAGGGVGGKEVRVGQN